MSTQKAATKPSLQYFGFCYDCFFCPHSDLFREFLFRRNYCLHSWLFWTIHIPTCSSNYDSVFLSTLLNMFKNGKEIVLIELCACHSLDSGSLTSGQYRI
ncbi:uncharacterized protein A4U43_C04F13780 [Asparagus officinalis]|uniref:Uncharacterized protein n=1 Tax=Asparagus officinalis TaxID=4686 RepID=A0A5P1F5G2_ASPOF|nr:uncharacterized protein A4U43_C04F13780 [Asparagus officinalis]